MATLDELQQQLNALQQKVDAITAPPTDYYTQRYSGEETDRGVEIALGLDPDGTGIVTPEHGGTGASTPQAALAALGAGVRPNDLDNAYFIGGGSQQGGSKFPINQQGLTSWTSAGPIIDRWELATVGSITLSENGLTVVANASSSSEIVQKINDTSVKGKTKTFSAFTSAGFISGTSTFPVNPNDAITVCDDGVNFALIARIYPDGTPVFDMWTYPGKTVTWYFVKQEDGIGQTSVYKNSEGNWQLLPQPDSKYGAQLLECQRYQVYNSASAYFRASYVSANAIGFNIPVPNTLRTNPVFDGSPNVQPINLSGAVSGFTFAYYTYPGHVRAVATKTGHGLSDAVLVLPVGMFNSSL